MFVEYTKKSRKIRKWFCHEFCESSAKRLIFVHSVCPCSHGYYWNSRIFAPDYFQKLISIYVRHTQFRQDNREAARLKCFQEICGAYELPDGISFAFKQGLE